MSIKNEYRIELESVNAQAVAKVVEEEFGLIFLVAGCEIIFGDNDKKLHSVVTELFCESIFELSVSKMLGQSSALAFGREPAWLLIAKTLLRKQISTWRISVDFP